jgi:hypothetical protein
VAQAQNDLHLQTPGRIQHRLHIVLVEIQARGVHEVQDLPNAADALNVQVEDITLLARGVLKEAPDKRKGIHYSADSSSALLTFSYRWHSHGHEHIFKPLLL